MSIGLGDILLVLIFLVLLWAKLDGWGS